jgi:hypothetical protein
MNRKRLLAGVSNFVDWWPIVQRELLVTARGSRLLWVRIAPAFLIIATGLLVLLLDSPTISSQGSVLFLILAALLLLYVFLAGLVRSVDSISSERRGGTLQLLGLPGLSATDIVIGKLASASLEILSGVAAVLPLLWIPIMLGGVKGIEVLRMICVVLGTLALSTSIAIFASSRATTQDEALRKALRWLAGSLTLGCGVLLCFFRKRKDERTLKRSIVWEICIVLATFVGVLFFQYNLGSPVVLVETLFTGDSQMPPWSIPAGIVFLFLLSLAFLRRGCEFNLSSAPEDGAVVLRAASPLALKSQAALKKDPLLWLGLRGRRTWSPLLAVSISFLIMMALGNIPGPWANTGFPVVLMVVPWLLLPFYMAHTAAQVF